MDATPDRKSYRSPPPQRAFGTPAWIRTKDQLIKSQLLYQLSYRGMGCGGLTWEPMSLTGVKLARRAWVAKQKILGHGAKLRDGAEWSIRA